MPGDDCARSTCSVCSFATTSVLLAPTNNERLETEENLPLTDEFIRGNERHDRTDKNPYRDRYKALTETLDLDTQRDRYTLGRALYHLRSGADS